MTDTLTAIIAELRDVSEKASHINAASFWLGVTSGIISRLEKLRGDAWTIADSEEPILVMFQHSKPMDDQKSALRAFLGSVMAPPQAGAYPGPIVHPWDAVGTRNQPDPPLPLG